MFLLTVPDKGEIPKCQFVAGVLIFSERWIFFRTFIHLPGKKQGDIAGDNNDGGIDYLGDNLFTVEIPVYVLPDDRFYQRFIRFMA